MRPGHELLIPFVVVHKRLPEASWQRTCLVDHYGTIYVSPVLFTDLDVANVPDFEAKRSDRCLKDGKGVVEYNGHWYVNLNWVRRLEGKRTRSKARMIRRTILPIIMDTFKDVADEN